jgi:hypothetical protein
MFMVVLCLLLVTGLTPVLAGPPQQGVSGQGNLDDDVFTITCDTGEEIIGGTKFTFINVNPGFQYRVSAIGINGFDPVIAVITEPGIGACNDDEPAVRDSQVAVPGIGLVEANNLAAQVQVNTRQGGNIDVVVGGFQGSSGQFAMVVEGLAINPRDELDAFLISVPSVVKDEPIGVYMISRDGSSLNPYLEVYGGAGLQEAELDLDQTELLAVCNDVGIDECFDTPSFPGGGVLIRNGFRYEATSSDAGISTSLGSTDRFLYVFGSNEASSSGDYGIIVVGTAPGTLIEPTTTATACNNVATTVNSVSSTYSDRYVGANLLDNNPNTSWSSAVNQADNFVIMGLSGIRTVGEVRMNSTPTTADAQGDAPRDFIIIRLDVNGDLVTVLSATAAQQQGYQSYTFTPVDVNELGFVFMSNYGGTAYEVADIQVCAQ